MDIRSTWTLAAGRPNLLCCAISILLVLSPSGRDMLGAVYAWYVIAFGIAYAGRLPIHLLLGHYLCFRPREQPKPGLRARLNLLVGLNASSIVIWLVIGFSLLGADGPPSLAIAIAMAALWVFVLGLGLITVRCAADLGLSRGTELVCESALGGVYLRHYTGAPADSNFGRFLEWFRRKTPLDQTSAFLLLITAPLLTVPSAGATARLAEQLVPIDIAAPPPIVERRAPRGNGRVVLQPPPMPARESRTYEQICQGMPEPGFPAGEPYGTQLSSLWLGGAGIAGAGAIQAGCAGAALQVRAEPSVWVAEGRCGADLRSLGIAADGYLPALLFEQAAAFALVKARQGVLLGASSRHPLRSGDFYVLDTESGSFILIRPRLAAGTAPLRGERPCDRIPADDVAYSMVPPGLIGIWSEAVSRFGWVWPIELTPPGSASPEFSFRPRPEGAGLARAACTSETTCRGLIDGTEVLTSGSLFTTVAALTTLAH